MRDDIRRALELGLPAIAEGGGFLYLHETLDGFPMCGVIKGAAFKTSKLQRFGYITLTAARDNMLCMAGDSIRSREFHYWDSDIPGDGFTAEKAWNAASYQCVHATETLYAGFPHLYFPANPSFAERFVDKCRQFVLALE
jgi:cobyrinic acid a,c-diamide synthase